MMPTPQEWLEICRVSRDRRLRSAQALRLWYVSGRGDTASAGPVKFNKLASHLDLVTSYLYSPTHTRFHLLFPAQDRHTLLGRQDAARDDFTQAWHDSGTDVIMSQLVEWALVWGATVAKILPGPGDDFEVGFIDPSHFGVSREDAPILDTQDAFCHWFALTLPEVERLIASAPADQAARVREAARQMASPGQKEAVAPSALQQIIVSSVASSQVTGATDILLSGEETPEVAEETVEAAELWTRERYRQNGQTWDDWEVTTLIGEEAVLTRRNPILPGHPPAGADPGLLAECPFVAVRPTLVPDYFWGQSELLGLIELQAWREGRLTAIDKLLDRATDPSLFFSGMSGAADEKLRQFRNKGGYLSSSIPNARMDVLMPQIPENLFESLAQIDRMFAERSGVPELLQGGLPPQLRAGTQVTAVANLAVGRIRKRALVIEDAVETVATRLFHLRQRHATSQLADDRGQAFLLSQLPPDTKVKVSAHSSSPVYAEETAQKAAALLKAGAIDLPTFVELLNPPMMEALRDRARALASQKAELAKQLLEIQRLKAERGKPAKV